VGVTLFTAKAHMLTAQDTVNGSLTATVPVTVSPAPVSQFKIAAPASAGATRPFIITVTVYDLYGNLGTNYTGRITFATSDPAPLLPADYTYTASDSGTQNFGVVFFTPGNQTLIVKDTASGVAGSVTVTVTGPDAPPGGGARAPLPPTGTAGMEPTFEGQSPQKIVLLERLFSSVGVTEPTFGLKRFGHKKLADILFEGNEGMLT
jgi:hypothetical protein